VGDALGMPLEFGPRRPADCLVRDMQPGRLPAGTFTDDTEMALAVADSLLHRCPLDPADLAQRFAAWLQADPPDVGLHTRHVLARLLAGEPWEQAAAAVQRGNPNSAGNGSIMRSWPVALACWDDLGGLLTASRLQSCVTHPHRECEVAGALINGAIYHLLHGSPPDQALTRALVGVEGPLRDVVRAAPRRHREELSNSGWVRHTVESAVWGLLSDTSFEETLVQVVNLGQDADTAGAVTGALAGAAYGLEAIPARWRDAVQGEWPLGSGQRWRAGDLVRLADRLLDREP
jgi:ADP-ribosyl-[dinitrogen reductase] hydrolase